MKKCTFNKSNTHTNTCNSTHVMYTSTNTMTHLPHIRLARVVTMQTKQAWRATSCLWSQQALLSPAVRFWAPLALALEALGMVND